MNGAVQWEGRRSHQMCIQKHKREPQVYLKVEGNLNAEAEREKIQNKMEENPMQQQEKLRRVMSVTGYNEKVPVQI
ncbi:valine--tRNA ligase, mitochondrial 1-like [Punica granatum]|uniref:Valine--tRNA ligase, mitochondrial 1-like n=1 Tax=Punica granatum TaxID=22663 RepID=A0A6P8C1I3_PUNGR|nr:valine--tRNA ligase, mitochondrial 1-like [Punica granatum]